MDVRANRALLQQLALRYVLMRHAGQRPRLVGQYHRQVDPLPLPSPWRRFWRRARRALILPLTLAAAYVNSYTAVTNNTEDPKDVTGVGTGSGSNRYMLAVAHLRAATAVSSVTLDPGGANETAFSSVADFTGGDASRIVVYELINPPSGLTAQTVRFDFAAAQRAVLGVLVFDGVHQTTPRGTAQTDSGTDATTSITIPTPASDSLCVSFLASRTTTSTNPTFTGDQTERYETVSTGGSGAAQVRGAAQTAAGTGSDVAMGWTLSNAHGHEHWGVEIKAAPSGFTGSGALTVPAPSVAATGSLQFSGSGALTIPQPSVAGAGTHAPPVTGTGALTVPTPSVAATGVLAFQGSGALLVPMPSLAASGLLTFSGSGALTVPSPAVAGTGTLTISGFSGSGALTVPAPSLAASGTLTFSATGALTVPTPAVAASGLLTFAGTGALGVPPPAVASTGLLQFLATAALSVPTPSIDGTGAITAGFIGTAAIATPAPIVSGAGQLAFLGSGAVTVTAPALAGTGAFSVSAIVGKYAPEHRSALADLGAAEDFAAEHRSALRDLADAGL